jgi:hypothetical protein
MTRVEVGWNTSTVALRAVRGDKNGNPVPGGITGLLCSRGDINKGIWPYQVGGVSDETVKYDREFCGTSTQE